MATRREYADSNIALLVVRFDAMVRSGEDSLRAAYAFGMVASSLYNLNKRLYNWQALGREVGRTGETVRTYAKLYERYPTEKAMLDMSGALDTVDYAKLASPESHPRYTYAYHCQNCGSSDVRKVRIDDSGVTIAAEVREHELARAREIEDALARRGHPQGQRFPGGE